MRNPSVWGALPRDLLLKIWSFLPLRSVLLFRSVSKSFHSLPSLPHFQDLCFPLPSKPPPLFLKPNPEGPAPCYSPAHCKWSLLHPDFLAFEEPDFLAFEGRIGYSNEVLAAAGGLICCCWKVRHTCSGLIPYPRPHQLVVGNPFTTNEVFLPQLPDSIHPDYVCDQASLMIAGNHGGELAFKLVLGVCWYARYSPRRGAIIVFDSTLRHWLIPTYPGYFVGGDICVQSDEMVIVDGSCYALISSPDRDNNDHAEFWLLAIHIQSPGMPGERIGRWVSNEDDVDGAEVYDDDGQLLDGFPVISLCIHIVECKGQVGIAGLMQGGKDYTIGIFVYDKATKSLKQRWELPEDMADAFLGDDQWHIGCATAGDLIFFTSRHSSHGILFDTSEECWSWAPNCPEPPHERYKQQVLTFYPRLDTRPQPCMG